MVFSQVFHFFLQCFCPVFLAHVRVGVGEVVFAGDVRTASAGELSPFVDTAVVDRADGDVYICCPEWFSRGFPASGAVVRIGTGVTVCTAAGSFHRELL